MPSKTKPNRATATRKKPPAGNGLLKEQAYHQLRELILSGKLSDEPFVSERMLAKQLGMSNTPVRSAIERLEQDGMIEIGPQRGIVVRELSISEIVNHFEIREALEPFIVSKLAGRLSREQVKELRANQTALEKSIKAGNVREFVRLDDDFHQLLAEFSGNADIERVVRQLRDRIFRVISRIVEHIPNRIRETGEEHRQIIRALVDGDGNRAAKLMRQHLERGLRGLAPGHGGQKPRPTKGSM